MAGISFWTGLYAAGTSAWATELWDRKGDPKMKFADWGVATAGNWSLISSDEVMKYNFNKLNELNKENPGFTAIALSIPVAGTVSVISCILYIKTMYSLFKYNGKLNENIKKWQDRIDRDNVIIGELKKLKYKLAH